MTKSKLPKTRKNFKLYNIVLGLHTLSSNNYYFCVWDELEILKNNNVLSDSQCTISIHV